MAGGCECVHPKGVGWFWQSGNRGLAQQPPSEARPPTDAFGDLDGAAAVQHGEVVAGLAEEVGLASKEFLPVGQFARWKIIAIKDRDFG